jgi:formate hydrogenlyase transcriptional activator
MSSSPPLPTNLSPSARAQRVALTPEEISNISPDLLAVRSREQLVDLIQNILQPLIRFSELSIGLPDDRDKHWSNFIYCNGINKKGREYLSRIIAGKYPVADDFFSGTRLAQGAVVWDLRTVLTWKSVPTFVTDVCGEGRITDVGREARITEAVSAPLSPNQAHTGCLFLFFENKRTFSRETLSALTLLARQLGACINNILREETTVCRLKDDIFLLSLCRDIAGIHTKEELSRFLHDQLKQIISFSHAVIGLLSEDKSTYTPFLLDPHSPSRDSPDYRQIIRANYPVADGLMDYALASKEPMIFDLEKVIKKGRPPAYVTMNYQHGIREVIFSPLTDRAERIGVLAIFSAERRDVGSATLRLVQEVSCQLSLAVLRILAREKIQSQMEEITRYKQQLEEEKNYLQEELKIAHNYNEMVGTGSAMRKVFTLVSQVAPTDSSVLIMGETGTGKELVARALHNTSLRKDKIMVKVNCASIPANLIESELFGHERGSFTGATDRRIGKFELANHGTLFLDEIGELPLDLQSKLLRALQEKEIERVGGRSVIKTDVRIIAATNRDLGKEVKAGNFRSDLYYRLNVFPIGIPPLRERKEDIPGLTAHFLNKYAKRSGKVVMNFSQGVTKRLLAYDWPGNVRELEHLVERSVLLTTGPTINQLYISLSAAEAPAVEQTPGSYIKTIGEVEREHILSVLEASNGKVSGPGGAAERLRIPPTTLASKIARLNIKKGLIEK